MNNALTIDVEDYFHVTAFEGTVQRKDWDYYPLRVVDNTHRVLDLLDEFGRRGTFFVLGWVAEKAPELVRAIARRGHEVACHGYGHELVYTLSREDFRRDVTSAKSLLEDILGQPVTGYRAPSYSITERSMWALDVLVEAGFTYDSSIFPIVHDNYGVPHAERFPHVIEREAGSLVEFPLTTLRTRLLGREFNLPIAGGGYLRLLPASLVARGIKRINRTERQPAVLYFHPWEVDPDQPRIKAGLKSSFRHYLNLDKTEDKLRHMLCAVPFGTMRAAIAEWSEARQACPAAEAAAEAT